MFMAKQLKLYSFQLRDNSTDLTKAKHQDFSFLLLFCILLRNKNQTQEMRQVNLERLYKVYI